VREFDYFVNVPRDFSGFCYLRTRKEYRHYKEGRVLHNLLGPAVIRLNGKCAYYLYDDYVSFEEWRVYPKVIQAKMNSILNHET